MYVSAVEVLDKHRYDQSGEKSYGAEASTEHGDISGFHGSPPRVKYTQRASGVESDKSDFGAMNTIEGDQKVAQMRKYRLVVEGALVICVFYK